MWCVVQTLGSHLGSQWQSAVFSVSEGAGLSCAHGFQAGIGCRLQGRSLRRGLEEAALIRTFLQTLMSIPRSHLHRHHQAEGPVLLPCAPSASSLSFLFTGTDRTLVGLTSWPAASFWTRVINVFSWLPLPSPALFYLSFWITGRPRRRLCHLPIASPASSFQLLSALTCPKHPDGCALTGLITWGVPSPSLSDKH